MRHSTSPAACIGCHGADDFLHDFVHVDRRHRQRRAPELRKTQQVVDQLTGRRGGLIDAVQIMQRLSGQRLLTIAQQLGVTNDVPERGTQIVTRRNRRTTPAPGSNVAAGW